MAKASFLRSALLASLLTGPAWCDRAFAEGVGPDQNVMIATAPSGVNAHCYIDNAAGQEIVAHAPQMANVMKAAGKTTISCMSYDGVWNGTLTISARPDGWAILSNLPWLAFSGVSGLGSQFEDRGGAAAVAGSVISFNDAIVVPMHRVGAPQGPSATPVSMDEAIADQPIQVAPVAPPDVSPAPAPAVKHHHRRAYHVAPAHS